MKHDNKSIQELYTKNSSLYHFLFFTLFRYHRGMQKFFSPANYLAPNMKILDAGCGSGLITQLLHAIAMQKKLPGVTFHSFDLTPAMLERFQTWITKNNIKNIRTQQANVLNLEQLPDTWNNYDLIVSSAMLEYVPKDKIQRALANLKKLLKPHGSLVLFISHNNFFNRWLIQKKWHANLYNEKEIEDLLNQVGFNQITFKQFPFPYGYLNHWGIIIEAQ